MATRLVRMPFLMTILLTMLSTIPAQAKDGWFGAEKPGARALFYGEVPPPGEPPNAETIYLALSCPAKGKAIVLRVAETSESLTPGKAVRVIMTAATARSTAMGKTLPNQLAGVPSIEAPFPLDAAVFAAMSDRATLRIRAGAWGQDTPLKGLGDRMKNLLAACRK